jgi:hypothetical protein
MDVRGIEGGEVSNQTPSLQDKREWARKHGLQHAVLLYLWSCGPVKWDKLFDYFDQERAGEIGSALRHLAQWKHISIDTDSNTDITESGTEQLLSMK